MILRRGAQYLLARADQLLRLAVGAFAVDRDTAGDVFEVVRQHDDHARLAGGYAVHLQHGLVHHDVVAFRSQRRMEFELHVAAGRGFLAQREVTAPHGAGAQLRMQ